MKCLYCGKKVPMVKKLTAEEFCTVAHRQAYFAEQEKLAVARLLEAQQRQRSSRKPLPRGKVAVELEAPVAAGFVGEAPVARGLGTRLWLAEDRPQIDTPVVLPGLELRLRSAHNQLAGAQVPEMAEVSAKQDVGAAMAALGASTAIVAMAPCLPPVQTATLLPICKEPAGLLKEDWAALRAHLLKAPAILPAPIASQPAAVLPQAHLEPLAEELGALDAMAEGPMPLPVDLSRRLKPIAPPRHGVLVPYAASGFSPGGVRLGNTPARLAVLPAPQFAPWRFGAIAGPGWLAPSHPPRPMDIQYSTRTPAHGGRLLQAGLPWANDLELLMPPEDSRPAAPPAPSEAPPASPAMRICEPAVSLATPEFKQFSDQIVRVFACPALRLPRPPQLEAHAHTGFTSHHFRQPATTGGPALLVQRPAGKCQPFREMRNHPAEFLRAVEIPLQDSRFQFDEPISPRARIASVRRSTLGVAAKTYRNSKLQRLSIHPDSGSRELKAHDWKPWPSKPVELPKLKLKPAPVKAGHSLLAGLSPFTGIGHQFAWESLKRRWQDTPNDLRWVALAVPLVMGLLWFSGSKPAQASLRAAIPDVSGFTRISFGENSFSSLKQSIKRRAAVELVDDFRQGLGEWAGDGDWSRGWSYDPAGFVRPRKLALYTPTLALEDYRLEFLGAIERKALSWVFRAADVNNYYAARLEVTRGGPLPKVELVRWAVIKGRSGPKKSVALPMQTRMDTIYRVRVDVRGNDFVTSVQGQVVDVFSDDRLPRGGVGFFSEAGEDARLRWVEVSHQYDMLGRLCAYLVPYNDSNSNVRSAP
jgi:hypothetical protein